MSAALFEARAQNAPAISGCSGPAQTHAVKVDVDENGKVFYREGDNDASTLRVCPGDDVEWSGTQDSDAVTISFSKQDNHETPADDGQLQTSKQPAIHKHMKRRHTQTRYSYTVVLSRAAVDFVDDPLIIIGH